MGGRGEKEMAKAIPKTQQKDTWLEWTVIVSVMWFKQSYDGQKHLKDFQHVPALLQRSATPFNFTFEIWCDFPFFFFLFCIYFILSSLSFASDLCLVKQSTDWGSFFTGLCQFQAMVTKLMNTEVRKQDSQ